MEHTAIITAAIFQPSLAVISIGFGTFIAFPGLQIGLRRAARTQCLCTSTDLATDARSDRSPVESNEGAIGSGRWDVDGLSARPARERTVRPLAAL